MKLAIVLSIVIIGAGVTACSSYFIPQSTRDTNQRVDQGVIGNSKIDSLVAPYKRELDKEMSQIIGRSLVDFQVARPSSNLGSWVADAALNYVIRVEQMNNEPVICLLNTGGIRAALSKGSINKGDIFKVMPFDNRLVAVKLPISVKSEILAYLKMSGGEPISGFTVQNGAFILSNKSNSNDYIWVITTDFLANGGDKMLFFQNAIEKKAINALLRDVLIQTVIDQQEIGNESYTERINW
jgi:2',3'-cyclic-nucleotide 2'-phosphodiesterase (5'-nucleotidase family)